MIVENIQARLLYNDVRSKELATIRIIFAMTHAFTMNLLINMLQHPVKSFQSDKLSNRNVAATIPIHCLKRDCK